MNEFRYRADLSVSLLAQAAGIPEPTLKRWAGDKNQPREWRWRDVVKIAGALNLKLVEADRLLRAGGYKPIVQLYARHPGADDTALFSHWLLEIQRQTIIPSLPDYFQVREDSLARLKALVLGGGEQYVVITGKRPSVGIQGMGGIGKTLLAVALTHDPDVQAAFPDGIYWLTVGDLGDLKAGGNLQLLNRQVELARLIGDGATALIDTKQAASHLRQQLRGMKCLLVLDDVWQVDHVQPLAAVDATSGGRLLVTTRNRGVLTGLRAHEMKLDVLSRSQSRALLAHMTEMSLDELPPEADELADRCEDLPLALVVCGANVADGYLWGDLLTALDKARLDYLDHEQGSVMATFQASVERLSDVEVTLYQTLAIFPEDIPLPEKMLVTFWAHHQEIEPFEVRRIISRLEGRALLDTTGTPGERRISLHDLLHLFVRQKAGERIPGMYRQWKNVFRPHLFRPHVTLIHNWFFFSVVFANEAGANDLPFIKPSFTFLYGEKNL
ncbi:MAG: hypothetical protein GY805_11280 [Chloroflexi bacterium]|nr:hypothetical protein [Chloroflexota bacterium]